MRIPSIIIPASKSSNPVSICAWYWVWPWSSAAPLISPEVYRKLPILLSTSISVKHVVVPEGTPVSTSKISSTKLFF